MAQEKNIPMRVVKEQTGLTSRQIRYYDQKDLIFPRRTEGNHRLFSEEDIKRLKKIKSLLEKGYTIKAIKRKLKPPVPLKANKKGKGVEGYPKRINKGDLTNLYPASSQNPLRKKI